MAWYQSQLEARNVGALLNPAGAFVGEGVHGVVAHTGESVGNLSADPSAANCAVAANVAVDWLLIASTVRGGGRAPAISERTRAHFAAADPWIDGPYGYTRTARTPTRAVLPGRGPVRTGAAEGGGGYGVSFFDSRIARLVDNPQAKLGRANDPHFFMPIEDAATIKSTADAARQTGMAPSVVRAYLTETPVLGISFPTRGLAVRVPTAADANGWAHYLQGGRTAVATEGPMAGYLLNSTRKFVVLVEARCHEVVSCSD